MSERPPLALREGRAMASPLRLTVAGGVSEAAVDAAWAVVRDEFERVEAALSGFREDSEATLLHRARRAGQPSWRLVAALTAAARANRITEGRFDARILRDLERLGGGGIPQAWARAGGAPDQGAPFRRAGRGGPIELLAPVDFGGIGKGLALRWAVRRAEAAVAPSGGVAGFLLEAGGDRLSRGSTGAGAWSIGIEDPAGVSSPVAVVELSGGLAIATSSVRIGRWRDPTGRPVHHLIDPRTGEPGGAGLLSVTVAWPDPAWAEVWSKALFLEGRAAIAAVARRRGLAAWWVTDDGELSMTPAARALTPWVGIEARC